VLGVAMLNQPDFSICFTVRQPHEAAFIREIMCEARDAHSRFARREVNIPAVAAQRDIRVREVSRHGHDDGVWQIPLEIRLFKSRATESAAVKAFWETISR